MFERTSGSLSVVALVAVERKLKILEYQYVPQRLRKGIFGSTSGSLLVLAPVAMERKYVCCGSFSSETSNAEYNLRGEEK